MTLESGTRLGTFEITGLLGTGGMGEVYRATDTRLGRDVAIKTLPTALADDKDRLARFEREARLLAALNHAHIASVYSLDEQDGTAYIAMELVEGETLERRLESGALNFEEALQFALQIAQALEAAHDKGVVHRDLKPANVMITPDGVVKVLDFGLAKAFSGDGNAANPIDTPALSAAMTQQGLILGTAGYMSPEQASGQATDHRSDIWSFGVVCYEMLAGTPLFRGESVPHILADVLKSEPDWSRLPGRFHPRLALMLKRCLDKKLSDRYHSIADARVDIEAVLGDPGGVIDLRSDRAETRQASIRLVASFALAIAVTAAVSILLTSRFRPDAESPLVGHFVEPIDMPEVLRRVVVSRDGARAAFVGGPPPAILVREIGKPGVQTVFDTLENRPEGAATFCFSPDGTWVAFESSDMLRRAPVSGGTGVNIVERFGDMLDCEWADDGYIYFARRARDGGAIERVPFAGGDVEVVAEPEFSTGALRSAQDLPDGTRRLITTLAGSIIIQDVESGSMSVVPAGNANATARFIDTYPGTGVGHLVFLRDDTIFAAVLDLEDLVAGAETPVVEDVLGIAVSSNGTLAYMRGSTALRTIDAVDRQGNWSPLLAEPQPYRNFSLSPNGQQILITIDTGLFVKDLGGGPLTPLVSANVLGAQWSPDGNSVVYSTANFRSLPPRRIESMPIDRSEAPVTNWGGGNSQIPGPGSISPDGRTLVGTIDGPGGLWALPLSDAPEAAAGAELQVLVDTDGTERDASFSPDGRWIVYSSDESGEPQIYVIPWPGPGRPQPVTFDGGREPRWNPAGGELFFLDGARLMAVDVATDGAFRVLGEPEFLIEDPALEIRTGLGMYRSYDVTPDGMQFVMMRDAEDPSMGSGNRFELHLVMNWTEELKRLVPIE